MQMRLDVVNELLGLFVSEMQRLATHQIHDNSLVYLFDFHGADVLVADQQLNFSGGVLQQSETHRYSLEREPVMGMKALV
jgi:hypothetical protein